MCYYRQIQFIQRDACLEYVKVIGAVGFMNQRLEIPKDIDPLWIALMESCWHR